MSSPDQKREGGYKSPPFHSRWKKGQCGNPKRRGTKRPKGVVDMIDEFFASQIKIVESGAPRSCSAFEAILMQLLIRADGGNKRAARVLLKYKNFALMDGESPTEVRRELIIDGRVIPYGRGH